MSKYIKTIPLGDVQLLQIYINVGRKTLAQIKKETGADHLLNGGLFDMGKWKAVCHLKANGYVWADNASYQPPGYAWDSGADIAMIKVPAERQNYISCCQLIVGGRPEQKLYYNPDVGGSRPRSALGMVGDKLCLYCTDGGVTPEGLRDELHALGWDSAVMLDGGGSSQCDFQGSKITSGRKVHNLILVHLKKEGGLPEKEEPMKIVCLDPGHGVESPGKQSPDGSYFEHEFNLDMARRVKAHLERHGVKVVLTRSDEHCPTGRSDTADLNKRVSISDGAGADLFVSLHSNAQGGTGWGTVRGYGIYTSAGPETAERNVAARKLLARAKEAGVPLWGGGLFHDIDLVVTRKTKAPAVLIEHGFHTHREEVELLKRDDYRAMLSEVDTKGILDFLGIEWVDVKLPAPVACPHCGGALRIEKGDA